MVATKPCKVLTFPKRWLHDLLAENANMRAAAVELQLKSGWSVRRDLQTEIAELKIENKKLETALVEGTRHSKTRD